MNVLRNVWSGNLQRQNENVQSAQIWTKFQLKMNNKSVKFFFFLILQILKGIGMQNFSEISLPALLSFEHLSVDGDFGVEHLLGIQESLELCDLKLEISKLAYFTNLMLIYQGLALFTHTSEGGVTVVERGFVLSLVVGKLKIQRLYDDE